MGTCVERYIYQVLKGKPVFPAKAVVRDILYDALDNFAENHDCDPSSHFFQEWFDYTSDSDTLKGGYQAWYTLLEDRYLVKTEAMVKFFSTFYTRCG
jgi:hypothetical protein